MLLSLLTNKISLSCKKVLVLGFLFCSVVTFNAVGQEERRMHHSDSPAEYDELNDRSGVDIPHTGAEAAEVKETKVAPKKDNKDNLHKLRGEKEVKKEGLSTLSFNLFLYVVDRFKEDN